MVGTEPAGDSRWQWYNGLAWVEGSAVEFVTWMQQAHAYPAQCRPHGSTENPRAANLWGFPQPIPW